MKASFFNLIKRIFWQRSLHPLIVRIYGWHVRGTIALQKRGLLVHHPLYALLSRRHVHHAALIGIALMALAHTAMLQRVDEQEFLVPVNAISRLVGEDDEFVFETESSAQSLGKEYVPTVGLRPQPGTSDDEGVIAPPPADPGTLAAIPGTLIKPVLPKPEASENRQAQTIKTYVVKPGDTLSSIASAHRLRLATLLWANNLAERSVIRIGQRLIILPTDGVHYRIQRGDTLGVIARRYGADVDKIMRANNLTNPNAIAIGELLIIPDGIMPTIRPAERQQSFIARVRNVIAPRGTSVRAGSGFIWPTSARRITQYFGWRHTGVDIAGPTSNRIYAAADGVVTFAGWARGYGLSVVVDHGNGRQTRYAHSRQLFVARGESVSQGETIAMVGSTGRSTGPHLHFEVMVGGRRVNPFLYIR